MPEGVSALSLSRARAYCGKILHHGIVNNVKIVRVFRKGMARYEQRLMDEHLEILDGETAELKHQFVDDNRMTFGQFTDKHNNYASGEAALLLDAEFHLTGSQIVSQESWERGWNESGHRKTDMRRCLYFGGLSATLFIVIS